jgi:hypothetical protein
MRSARRQLALCTHKPTAEVSDWDRLALCLVVDICPGGFVLLIVWHA